MNALQQRTAVDRALYWMLWSEGKQRFECTTVVHCGSLVRVGCMQEVVAWPQELIATGFTL